jgi:hypothetical protein
MNAAARKTGFTLIEVQRGGIGQQEMQEDVRLFLQLFSREARTAFSNTYVKIENPPGGVVFRNQEGRCVYYAHATGAGGAQSITRAEATPPLKHPCTDLGIYPAGRTITDTKNTVIADLRFEAVSAKPAFSTTDTEPKPLMQQGFVTVYLTTHPINEAGERLYLQSTVTSRQFTPYDFRERP